MAQMADIALYTPCTRSFLFDHPREKRRKAVSKMVSICKKSVARFTQMGLSGKVKGRSYRIASHMLSHVRKYLVSNYSQRSEAFE